MTDNHPPGSAPPQDEPSRPRQQDPAAETAETAESAESAESAGPATEPVEDPGYLTETGEAVGDDGSVVPIIGGLPAAEGSAWDIGAPADERGAALADEQASHEDQARHEDTQ